LRADIEPLSMVQRVVRCGRSAPADIV
jgi:hypothetical protein